LEDPAVAVPEFATASNTWTTRAPMLDARFEHAAGVVNDASGRSMLYVIGGMGPSRVDTYNPSTNTWSKRAAMPAQRVRPSGVGVISGKLYLPGGIDDDNGQLTKTLYVYDSRTNTWTRKQDLPRTAFGGVSGVINGKLYVLIGAYTRLLYRYDPATNRWTRLADCPEVHTDGAGGVVGGRLYVVGGQAHVNATVSRRLHVYDPVTNRWTTKAPMPTGRTEAAAVVLNRKLYVMGGARGSTALRTVEAYDPATNTWATKRSMPTARWGVAGGAVNVSGRSYIHALGGYSNGNWLSVNEAYTP
jgi:N-acetylneuraminic acid mutarotase